MAKITKSMKVRAYCDKTRKTLEMEPVVAISDRLCQERPCFPVCEITVKKINKKHVYSGWRVVDWKSLILSRFRDDFNAPAVAKFAKQDILRVGSSVYTAITELVKEMKVVPTKVKGGSRFFKVIKPAEVNPRTRIPWEAKDEVQAVIEGYSVPAPNVVEKSKAGFELTEKQKLELFNHLTPVEVAELVGRSWGLTSGKQ